MIKNFIKDPARFFAVVAFIAGLSFLILTPPFQGPDEINHFYKAYQVSSGKMVSDTVDKRLGGWVPTSFVTTSAAFKHLRWSPNSKTSAGEITRGFAIPLKENDQTFLDFPNTGLFSPVSYIPQAFSILVLKQFNLSPLAIFYGCRLFTFLFWLLGMFTAIKWMPARKWLVVFLALLPMSLYTNMSLSADVVTNVAAFLLIARVLKLTFSEDRFVVNDLLWLAGLGIVLASAKIVYTPLLLLLLMVPLSKFKGRRHFLVVLFLLFGMVAGTVLFWWWQINSLYIPYSEYNPAFRDGIDLMACANMNEQMDYILTNGLYIFKVLIKSVFLAFDMYYRGYIGTFGWLDTFLPLWIVHLGYAGIFAVTLLEPGIRIPDKPKHKVLLLIAACLIVVLLLLSQHLTWDCVGGPYVPTIQGRYLIPVAPLLLLIIPNIRGKKWLPVLLAGIFLLLFLFSIKTIYKRYYVAPEFSDLVIYSGAEELASNGNYRTSRENITLENPATRSPLKARTGNYSVLLTPEHPYAFTFRYFEATAGTMITAEAWRKGKEGIIVVSGSSGSRFYKSVTEAGERDKEGWEKLSITFTLSTDMAGSEVGVFLYNPSPDSVYFDDFKLTIRRNENL